MLQRRLLILCFTLSAVDLALVALSPSTGSARMTRPSTS
jgi:hypothetical protein